jgi:hypothetical protein
MLTAMDNDELLGALLRQFGYAVGWCLFDYRVGDIFPFTGVSYPLRVTGISSRRELEQQNAYIDSLGHGRNDLILAPDGDLKYYRIVVAD